MVGPILGMQSHRKWKLRVYSTSWQVPFAACLFNVVAKTYLAAGVFRVVAKPMLLIAYSQSWQNMYWWLRIQSRGITYFAALLPAYEDYPKPRTLYCNCKDVADGATARALDPCLFSIECLLLNPIYKISIKYRWTEWMIHLRYICNKNSIM